MKIAIVLFACVAAASAQGGFFSQIENSFSNLFGRPARRPARPRPTFQQQQFTAAPQFQQQPQQSFRGGQADDQFLGNSYHYSWRHDGNQKYTGDQADRYCRGLGGGWLPISIESGGENDFVTRVIQGERLDYIWTGARRSGSGFSWPSGGAFSGIAWSHTGGAQRPQPDNREQGGEQCLAVLNNFYNDGVKWHDVACHHLKPVICERRG